MAETMLLPHHAALLQASTVSDEIVRERGYRSIERVEDLLALGFAEYQCRVPGLLTPVSDVFGENGQYSYRPDEPRLAKGKSVKYETPEGSRLVVDVPDRVKPFIGDVRIPLWITESPRKADALLSHGFPAIAVTGVWGWRGRNDFGGLAALGDWEGIAFRGKNPDGSTIRRKVTLCFDSDQAVNPQVHGAVERCAAFVRTRGANVRFACIPHPESGKLGIDDYFGLGHTADDIKATVVEELPPVPTRPDAHAPIPLVTILSAVEPERIDWLWRGRLAAGKMTILDGDPGLGKSTAALDIAARITTGEPFPGEVSRRPPRGVVVLSAEDGLADTVVPRFMAAGGDLDRIGAMTGVLVPDGPELAVTIPDQLAAIQTAIRERDAALLIIDPLVAHFSQTINANNDQQVRTALKPLATMLEETRCASFMLRHMNKADSKQVLYRGGGSIGIIGAARFGLVAARDPDDDLARIIAITKCNLGVEPPSLRYRLEGVPGTDVARVVWDVDASRYSAADLLAGSDDHDDRDDHDEAVLWLEHLLGEREISRQEVYRDGKKNSFSDRSIKRAKKVLKVLSKRSEFQGEYVWCLPPKETPWDDPSA
jgi:hypothetical protein